jgi:hypothetical protein
VVAFGHAKQIFEEVDAFAAIILTRRAFPAWASTEPASRLRNSHPLRPAKPPPYANEPALAQSREQTGGNCRLPGSS